MRSWGWSRASIVALVAAACTIDDPAVVSTGSASDSGGSGSSGGAVVDPSTSTTTDATSVADGTSGQPTADSSSGGGPPFEGDPEQQGYYSVFEQDTTIPTSTGDLAATIYAPSSDGGRTIAFDEGPFPLVVIMPGWLGEHGSFGPYSRHLASWGYVALGITWPDNGFTDQANHPEDAQEAIEAISWAIEGSAVLIGAVDPTRIATAGHSKGGKIAFFAAALDPRITAVIGWDPVDTGQGPCFISPMGCNDWSVAPNSFDGDMGMMDAINAAILIFGAPPGMANPEEHNAIRFWEGTPAPGAFVLFPDGQHTNWPGAELESRISRPSRSSRARSCRPTSTRATWRSSCGSEPPAALVERGVRGRAIPTKMRADGSVSPSDSEPRAEQSWRAPGPNFGRITEVPEDRWHPGEAVLGDLANGRP